MANKTPIKAIFSGSDVTSLGEFASGDTIIASLINGVPTGSLALTGGAMTGAITTNSTFDGVDIATRDAILTSTTTTAGAALPKAGGTMTGGLDLNDDVKIRSGTGNDLEIYHDGDNSYIKNATGALGIWLDGNTIFKNAAGSETIARFNNNSDCEFYYDNAKKLETSANGITVTGTAVATTDTDTSNTGSITLDFATKQNFVLTLTGNVTLANPSTEQVGQSGFIAFIQDGTGSRTVSLGTDYETAAAAGLTLTATASATDLVPYLVVASNRILLGTPQLAFA
jgi:hypothetical protein